MFSFLIFVHELRSALVRLKYLLHASQFKFVDLIIAFAENTLIWIRILEKK